MFDLNQIKNNASAIALIIVNLFPIVGVYFYGWDQGEILLLYWAESAIIGFYTVLKMLAAKKSITQSPVPAIDAGVKIYSIVFFLIHFSGFMFGHFVFLSILFKKSIMVEVFGAIPKITGNIFILPAYLVQNFFFVFQLATVAVVLLFISHGISFVTNYVMKKEYENADSGQLMFAPYKRIILMHVAIIIGAIANLPFLALILLKTAADLRDHLEERKRFAKQEGIKS